MKKYCLLIAAAAVLSLCGCSSVKKAMGFSHHGPDESSVKTNDPLILPPGYNVRPQKSKTETEEDPEAIFDE